VREYEQLGSYLGYRAGIDEEGDWVFMSPATNLKRVESSVEAMGMYIELSDGQLVARCRGGDQEAWNELVDRFSRYVYAIAVQAFKLPEHDAEDVFQEVFARAYEHLSKLRDDDAIRPWLAQLTRRLCIDRLRARAQEQPEDLGERTDVDDTVARLDEALTVHEALAILPDGCRDILDRFFARDESYRTISEALELPTGTIASRISRCLSKLRVEIEGRTSPSSAS
jgi:RNA polymerase sigma factor (sigma-70 family)